MEKTINFILLQEKNCDIILISSDLIRFMTHILLIVWKNVS